MNTTDRVSLEDAMEQFRLAEETRSLVRQIALRAGVIDCEVRSTSIRAFRGDDLHALHIGRRSTEWFGSRAEAVAASGLPDRVRDRTRGFGTVNWAVDHPAVRASRALRPSPTLAKVSAADPTARDYGVCETCWQARTPSGSCGCY